MNPEPPVAEDKAELVTQCANLSEQVRALKVTNKDEHKLASNVLVALIDMRAQAKAKLDPNVKRWKDGHTAACAERAEIVEPLESDIATVRVMLSDFIAADERRRLEAQRAAQEKADAEARAIKEAEDRKRAAALAAQAAELAKRQAEVDAERKRLWAEGQRKEAQRLKEAQEQAKAEHERNEREAAALKLAPAPQAEYVPVEEAPEAEGQSTKDVWEFSIDDPDKVPIKYRKIDEQKIRKQVAMDKGETRIPGVRVWKSKGIIQRRIQ